eukprot:SAG22_NODE_930_length_6462_cov_4.402326_3_plen_526_part_00
MLAAGGDNPRTELRPAEPAAAAAAQDPDPEALRAEIEQRLQQTPFMGPRHPLFMHGRAFVAAPAAGPGQVAPQKPRATWKSTKPPRDDHDAPKWLTATEYGDSAHDAQAKARQLADLIRLSRKTVLYTGAGISASVIGQAARSGTNTQGWKAGGRTAADPTYTHRALALLCKEGLVHSWVQQNHDGLPQKAGLPQEHINEIHGSWYDPSNPVVKYSGSLKDAEEQRMCNDAQTADLVIVLGSSLGGLYADEVATKTACRSRAPPPPPGGEEGIVPGSQVMAQVAGRRKQLCGVVTGAAADGRVVGRFVEYDDDDDWDAVLAGDEDECEALSLPAGTIVTKAVSQREPSLGTVCINLQQTDQDGKMSLRLFGKSDDVLKRVLFELGLTKTTKGPGGFRPVRWPREDRVLVPYDRTGRRLPDGSDAGKMWLDLRAGQAVKITRGHNIQGAKQPCYLHIGGTKPRKFKGQTRQPGPGHGRVVRRDEAQTCFLLNIEGATMKLGLWWLDAAVRGSVERLPVVNMDPSFE